MTIEMHRRLIRVIAAAFVLLAANLPLPAGVPPVRHPNLLVVILDDLGLDFWPYHPSQHPAPRTPRLDRIAAHGVLFDQAWASPYCSATRAQAITGRTSAGTGIFGPSARLAPEECTLPEALATWAPSYGRGLVGKWHLTVESPLRHGIEVARILAPQDKPDPWAYGWIDHYSYGHYRYPEGTVEKLDCNPDIGGDGSCYGPAVAIDDAIAWIRSQQAEAKPWFLWLGLSPIHFPYQAPPDEMRGLPPCPFESCAGKGALPGNALTTRDVARSMLEGTDYLLERLFAETGIEPTRDTYVLVLGDSGTDLGGLSPHSPFRGHKGTMYEGGLRVPFVLAGPEIPVGRWGTRSSELVHVRDAFATLLDAVGVPLTARGGVGECGDLVEVASRPGFDSVSLLDVIAGRVSRSTLYTDGANKSHTLSGQLFGYSSAARDRAGLKVLCPELTPEGQQAGVVPSVEAYDLIADPAETTNRIDDPELAGPVGALRSFLLECNRFAASSAPIPDGAE